MPHSPQQPFQLRVHVHPGKTAFAVRAPNEWTNEWIMDVPAKPVGFDANRELERALQLQVGPCRIVAGFKNAHKVIAFDQSEEDVVKKLRLLVQ